METTHEEADTIIVQQMVAAATENKMGISMLTDNTDIIEPRHEIYNNVVCATN